MSSIVVVGALCVCKTPPAAPARHCCCVGGEGSREPRDADQAEEPRREAR